MACGDNNPTDVADTNNQQTEQQTAQAAAPAAAKQTATPDESSHDGHQHATEQNIETFKVLEPLDTCDKPTVIEFFAYQCPHCFTLEEHTQKWKKSLASDVDFIAVPTDLGRQEFVAFLAIHHSAKELGVLPVIQDKLFGILHRKEAGFADFNGVIDMFVAAGIDRAKATATLQNETLIRGKLMEGFEMMKRYKITSVPQVLVNYQYLTSPVMAQGYDKVFPIVDELLAKPADCKSVKTVAAN
jgi:thiol:disulfide interchange protein DsbA